MGRLQIESYPMAILVYGVVAYQMEYDERVHPRRQKIHETK